MSLSIANHHGSLPVCYQLYLPQDWAGDAARRRKARVPADIVFKTRPEIAIDQIRRAVESGLPPGAVLADAGYGNNSLWRSEISALNLAYVVGVRADTTVWPPGAKLVARRKTRRSKSTKVRRGENNPVSVKELALALPNVPGALSAGAKVRTSSSPRALPACAYAPPMTTCCAMKNGC